MKLFRIFGPIATFIAVIAIWWIASSLEWVDALILPSPVAVVVELWTDAGPLAYDAGITTMEALSGLVIGNVLGLTLAILFIGSPISRRAVLPLAMSAQSIPIVAVTPALIIGFGNGMTPKIIVACFLVFFPMLVNSMRGLRSADAEVGELLHSLSANRVQWLWMVRLPAALPFIFTALRFSACGCFVAAIVSEWVAADQGLGHVIVLASSQYRSDEVWAAVLICTSLSMLMVGLVVLVERRAMPWLRLAGGSDI